MGLQVNLVSIFFYFLIKKKLKLNWKDGPSDRGSIPGWVIPKTQKMVLDVALVNTLYYKVRIMSKVEQSRERSSTLR